MVSMEFPSSLLPTPSPPPAVRDSRNTTHNHQHSSVPLHPNHLPFGNPLPFPKPDSTFRVGFCNIRGFPAVTHHNEKVSDIKHFNISSDLDLFGGCKSNLNWRCLPDPLQLREWFQSADRCRSFATNNIHEKFGKFQFGGTFWIAAGHATGHIMQSDKDPSNLGWWVSCSLQGHSGKMLTIIFAYWLCSNATLRLESVYVQHHCFFDAINRHSCPRLAFLEDLALFISTCRDARDAILVLGNMNSDIRHPTLQTFMSDIDLHELCYPLMVSQSSPLQQCSNMATILVKLLLTALGLWMTSVDHSPGNHRAIVININLVDCIGEPRYLIICPPGWQLNSTLPVTQKISTCFPTARREAQSYCKA